MTILLIFETRSTTEDNERRPATGPQPVQLSAACHDEARRLGASGWLAGTVILALALSASCGDREDGEASASMIISTCEVAGDEIHVNMRLNASQLRGAGPLVEDSRVVAATYAIDDDPGTFAGDISGPPGDGQISVPWGSDQSSSLGGPPPSIRISAPGSARSLTIQDLWLTYPTAGEVRSRRLDALVGEEVSTAIGVATIVGAQQRLRATEIVIEWDWADIEWEWAESEGGTALPIGIFDAALEHGGVLERSPVSFVPVGEVQQRLEFGSIPRSPVTLTFGDAGLFLPTTHTVDIVDCTAR